MKENLRRLQLIFRFTRLKPEMFYNISVTAYEIYLQGKAKNIEPLCDELKLTQQEVNTNFYSRNKLTFIAS